MKPILIFTLLSMLFMTVSSSAQAVNLESVDDAIAYALRHNPDLKIYKQNQKKAEYDYNAVKHYWVPTLSAVFSGVNNIDLPVTRAQGEPFGQPGRTVDAEFGAQYNYNAGLSNSINLIDFQSKFAARVAKMGTEIAEANADAYQQKLAEQVALYYYTALITKKALDVYEEDYKAAQDVLMLVQQKFEQGIVDQHTVNLTKINMNNISQNRQSYTIILEQCQSNLRILFGIDPETDLVSNEQLEPTHTKFPFIEFMAPDKSLEIYKLQLKQSDYRVNQQRAMWYPKLSINNYWGAQQYDDNFGISFNGSDWSKISYVSLNISIPIFDGFTTKNKVDSALIEYDNSMKTFEYEKLKSKIQDELILKEFNHSKKAVDIASDNYQIAKENAGLQFQKFEQGIVSLDNYLESFDDYLKAEVAYLNLLSDVYVHYSKILSRTI